VATFLVTLTLSGCWTSGAEEPSPAPPSTPDVAPAITSYAALGDSYTAAPFVPRTDLAGGCLRSDANYPSLLAEELDVADVRDVSCSAAESRDITAPQQVAGGQGTVPPQIRAVDQDTELVTVGIGGNDENLFGSLVGCVGGLGPDTGSGSGGPVTVEPCLDPQDTGPAEVVARTGERVEQVLRQVRRRAPRAEVVLVGYPRLLGSTTGCAAFPIERADLAGARALEGALAAALQSAARRAGAAYVDLHALSEGHEICSDDPWVNGRETDQSRALAFHPYAEGQQAVADAVVEELAKEEAP
jgi:lysophospholipase L1-like esterase